MKGVRHFLIGFVCLLLMSCNEGGVRQEGISPSPLPEKLPEKPPEKPIDPGNSDPRPIDLPPPTVMLPWRRIEETAKPVPNDPKRTILKSMEDRFKKEKEVEKADILWVIDNSCSMAEERDNVSKNLDAFISDFNVRGLDFQMAVISTHTNDSLFYGNPPILKHNDPLLKERFSERIRMEEVCTWNAAGLYSAYLALSEPRRSQRNKGFLRSDAFLIMIIISDADEDYEMTSVDYYTFFTSLKPGKPFKINISSIVGDKPSGCKSVNGNAEPGLQYIEMSEMTRGFFESICSENYSEVLARIGKNLDIYMNSYPLSSIPAQRYPIVVKVNGRVIEHHPLRGWSYNASLNVIQFTGEFKPQVGDTIEISYLSYEE